jgi:hypothetical protein
MGEYAKYRGQSVKIGTCEDMYYLRAGQRFSVAPEANSVHPNTVGLRYRFPWPDEDHQEPGSFDNYDRALPVNVPSPEGVEHYNVQFSAYAGYLTSLPCPEGPQALEHLTIHRNGFSGAVKLVRQKLLDDGRLVPICMCGGCGTMWRVEDPAEIEALAVAFRSEGDRRRKDAWIGAGESIEYIGHEFYYKIADRILAGARIEAGASCL